MRHRAGPRTRDGRPAGTAPDPRLVVAELVARNRTARLGPRKLHLSVARCRRQPRRCGRGGRRVVIVLDREGEFPGGPARLVTNEMDGLVRFVPRIADDADRPGALSLAFSNRDGGIARKAVIGIRRVQRRGAGVAPRVGACGRAGVNVKRNGERKARRSRLAERGGDRHIPRAGVPLRDRRRCRRQGDRLGRPRRGRDNVGVVVNRCRDTPDGVSWRDLEFISRAVLQPGHRIAPGACVGTWDYLPTSPISIFLLIIKPVGVFGSGRAAAGDVGIGPVQRHLPVARRGSQGGSA